MLIDLIQNIALLVTLAVGIQMLAQRLDGHKLLFRVAAGLLFGLVGVVGMMTPVHFAEGVIYDGRSIVLTLAGFIGGGLPAVLAGLICGAYRLHLGGDGAWAGTAVVVESAAFGVLLYYLCRRDARWERPLGLLYFGLLVHVTMLLLQIALLPDGLGWKVAEDIGLAIVLGYPLAFLFAAQIFLEGRRGQESRLRLARSEERYRSLFENNHAVMLLVDPSDGRIEDANPAAVRFYGWSREALRQMRISQINTLSPEEIQDEMQKANIAGRRHFFFQHRLADGTVRDVEVYSGPIDYANKRMLYALVHDITEQRWAEAALRESEAFQKAMIACSPFAFYSIDKEGRVLTWNASAEKIFGWKAEEVLGKPLPIVHENEQRVYRERREKVLAGESFMGYELPRRRKDGTVFVGRLSTAPVRDASGCIVGIMGAMEDITSSKQLEAQLRQSQKMESVGRLAGGVAHDFNNMLNVILGTTEMALEDLEPGNPLREDLEEIQKAGRRSADLTRQLLAFARKQTVAPKVLDLNETIESMLKMLRRLIGEHIDLMWKPKQGLDPVFIDPAQVDQMLANLLVNARDAIGNANGKVTIETGLAAFDKEYCASHAGFVPGRYVMMAVSDSGCGMDAETRNQIFEPFFTTKGVGRGTGLGLSTVYGIVKQNKGFINVYSETGEGTTFRIYLPVHAIAERGLDHVAERPEMPRAKDNETVLLVEDEPSLLKLTAKMLENLGYRTLQASTPHEAVRLAGEHGGEIHLLLTDVVMPEMNGRDLAHDITAVYPNLKCLFMSGYTANVIAHQGVLDPGVCFIQKPFSQNVLAQYVREALDS